MTENYLDEVLDMEEKDFNSMSKTLQKLQKKGLKKTCQKCYEKVDAKQIEIVKSGHNFGHLYICNECFEN